MTGAAGAPPPTLTVATLNLYHWAEPGVGWYGPDATHDAAGWSAKRAWLSGLLAEMDADLVGFQEVVSIESLRALCAEAGYAHFAVVAEPRIRPVEDGSERMIYVRPVQAVAARWPLAAEPVVPGKGLAHTLGLSNDRAFRRPAVRAEIELPGVGPVLAFCCHLKSPGVGVEDALMAGATTPPEAPDSAARWTLEALSRAHAAAMIQRVFEAATLYHAAAEAVAENPARPVFVLGDLNDGPDSAALAALTPLRAFERDGGALAEPASEADGEARAFARGVEKYRLLDAYRLSPRSLTGDGRPATHRSGASGEAIDFILVSSAFHPEAAERRGRLLSYRVHDSHFRSDPPALCSDHAGVSARFLLEVLPDRASPGAL